MDFYLYVGSGEDGQEPGDFLALASSVSSLSSNVQRPHGHNTLTCKKGGDEGDRSCRDQLGLHGSDGCQPNIGELVDRRATWALGASSRLLDVDEKIALENVLALFVLLAGFVGSVLSC